MSPQFEPKMMRVNITRPQPNGCPLAVRLEARRQSEVIFYICAYIIKCKYIRVTDCINCSDCPSRANSGIVARDAKRAGSAHQRCTAMMVTLSLVFLVRASCISMLPEEKGEIICGNGTRKCYNEEAGGKKEESWKCDSQACDANWQPWMWATASASLTTSHSPSHATMSHLSSGVSAI